MVVLGFCLDSFLKLSLLPCMLPRPAFTAPV
jgi:hypothetical protein